MMKLGKILCCALLVLSASGITLEQGLYWNVVTQYCDGVIIRGVSVNSFGHGRTDGVDIETTKNALVEYCSRQAHYPVARQVATGIFYIIN